MIKIDKILQIKDLIKRLNKYRDAYYNHNTSLISDKEYDMLLDKLELLENDTNMIFSNSPTQTVGYTSVSQLNKVKHNHPLLSLAKTTDISEFTEYFNQKDCIVMAKLDGLTCSLLYSNGELVRAESRGDGEVGEDITHNAKVFVNLPTKIPFDGDLIIDGECIITYKEFDAINQREDTEYKNPRNLVSGSVRQLNNRITKNRNVMFIAWKVHSVKLSDGNECPIAFHLNSFQWLKELGFDVVPHILVSKGNQNSYEFAIQNIKSECDNRSIPIDGAVGMFNDVEYGNSLGRTGHHPKHSLAYKFYQEENETVLKNIEWSTSRTGLVNPVAILEPIEIDGTTVSRASLSNVSVIEELELGIGDTVTVIKANQIIPKITQNLTRSNTYIIPTLCPACNKPLVIKNDNGRKMLYCLNSSCKAIIHDKITNFAERDAMNIVGISEERLQVLMDKGYINSFESLYHLKEHKNEIAQIKGFGKSSIEKMIEAIETSRKCNLSNVIVAIGIPGVGKSAARTISEYCIGENPLKSFVDLCKSYNDWSVLSEIGKTTSDNINAYVLNNLTEIEPLIDILIVNQVSDTQTSSVLAGKTFCITGKLIKFSNRDALVSDIQSKGGTVVSSVTSKTNYLITNDKNSGSSKNKAAIKFDTKIITEEEYIKNIL